MKLISATLSSVSIKNFDVREKLVTFLVELVDNKGKHNLPIKLELSSAKLATKDFFSNLRDALFRLHFDVHDIDSPTVSVVFSDEKSVHDALSRFMEDLFHKIERLNSSTAKDGIINQLGIIKMMRIVFPVTEAKK